MEQSNSSKKIRLVCNGLGEASLNKLAQYNKILYETVMAVDKALLNSLEINVSFRHTIDDDCIYREPVFNVHLDAKDANSEKSHNIICEYLEKGRRAIYTADYQTNDFFDLLIAKITEYSIEADELIFSQPYMITREYIIKHINKVTLAKAVEKVTSLLDLNKNGIVFTVCAAQNPYDVKSSTKRKADDLLGGRYVDKKPVTGDFIVSKINFSNIEKGAVFMRDGSPITVFITDKKWITSFNAGKITLAKDEKIKAVAMVERSPVTNKKVVYYFTEIKS